MRGKKGAYRVMNSRSLWLIDDEGGFTEPLVGDGWLVVGPLEAVVGSDKKHLSMVVLPNRSDARYFAQGLNSRRDSK